MDVLKKVSLNSNKNYYKTNLKVKIELGFIISFLRQTTKLRLPKWKINSI